MTSPARNERPARGAATFFEGLAFLATLANGCAGSSGPPQMVPMYDRDAAVAAQPLVPPPHAVACKIPFDREEMNHRAALDECLGEPRRACWSGCETACASCGEACVGDAACERRCLQERDTCKANHCADVHAQCRKSLVEGWLSNGCDAVCAPFRACIAECSDNPSPGCRAKCDAMGTSSCNPYRCAALLDAPERKTLDPRWARNDCDRVCGRVWRCAEARCTKASCGEPVKEYLPCVARVHGAKACGLAESRGLCPEPP